MATTANQTIVVTNHDPSYLEMLQDILEDEGYRRVVCVSADEAYDTIQHEQPGLVLLDIDVGQPAVGWQLLDRLRITPATVRTPVVLCSTDPRLPSLKADRLHELHCEFLEKPFLVEELLAKVSALIGPPAR